MSTVNMPWQGGAVPDHLRFILSPPALHTTPPLKSGAVYRITFQGCYTYKGFAWFSGGDKYLVDAVHHRDLTRREMPKEHNYLWIGIHQARSFLDLWQQIGDHKFCGIYEGCGQPLQFKLNLDDCTRYVDGGIDTTIERLLGSDPLLVWRREQEAEKGRRAAEQRDLRAAESAALYKTKLCRQVESLRRLQHTQRNFHDPEFRRLFLQSKRREILNEYKKFWQREYDELFENKELLALVKVEAPKVIEWHEARIDLILEAERIELATPKPQPVPAPRPPAPRPPPPNLYKEIIDKSNSDQKISLEPLVDRLNDIRREKIILEAKRRTAVRDGKTNVVQDLDRQLEAIRKELAEGKPVIEKGGKTLDLQERREREQTLEDLFFADYEEEQRIIDRLKSDGDTETLEAVRALYAERRAKLLQQDGEKYM